MKHFFLIGLFLALMLCTKSQIQLNSKASFADTVRKYFDYNSLSGVPCTDVPPGIYALSFRVNRHNVPYDFQCSADSLEALKTLLINAIKISAGKAPLKKSKKKYLQFCYFNILLWCNSSGDTTKLNDNIYSDLSKLLSTQLSAIEKSFKTSIKKADEYHVLEIVNINDNNPNIRKNEIGFRNDTKSSTLLTKEEVEMIIKEIEKRKKIDSY
jgi:hypothetical protein